MDAVQPERLPATSSTSAGARRPRVLFICMEPIGGAMAGQAIRHVELARALTAHADVTLATPELRGPPPDGIAHVTFAPHAPHALRAPIAAADLIFAPPQWPLVTGWLRRSSAQVVFDLYDPETLETLELFANHRPAMRRLMVALTLDRLSDALRTGHRFVCASEKQRDLWIGALLRSGRIDADSYTSDPTLRSLIDTVPCGVPAQRPQRSPDGGGMRAQLPGVAGDHEVVLWNGGVWSWLDAPTAIRAIASLATRRPKVRLVFMGASKHLAAQTATRAARELAASLGVLDRVVLFHDEWVPYEQRVNWLLDADCALSTHSNHIEARFAWRTRIVDCFWAGLPVVCTEGNDLAERVGREDLGAQVPSGDPTAVALAVERVLDRGRAAYAVGLTQAATELEWPRLAQPLIRWTLDRSVPRRPDNRMERLPRTPGQRLRRLAYLAGARVILARR
jgi:glycosyltransferase involved in cell wall biosynthesis